MKSISVYWYLKFSFKLWFIETWKGHARVCWFEASCG